MTTEPDQREVLEALWAKTHGGKDPQWCEWYGEIERLKTPSPCLGAR